MSVNSRGRRWQVLLYIIRTSTPISCNGLGLHRIELSRYRSIGPTHQCPKCSRDPAGRSGLFAPVSRLQTFTLHYRHRQLAVRILVGSVIAVFRLVDNIMPSRLQIVRWPNSKLKPFANSNRDNESVKNELSMHQRSRAHAQHTMIVRPIPTW